MNFIRQPELTGEEKQKWIVILITDYTQSLLNTYY